MCTAGGATECLHEIRAYFSTINVNPNALTHRVYQAIIIFSFVRTTRITVSDTIRNAIDVDSGPAALRFFDAESPNHLRHMRHCAACSRCCVHQLLVSRIPSKLVSAPLEVRASHISVAFMAQVSATIASHCAATSADVFAAGAFRVAIWCHREAFKPTARMASNVVCLRLNA